MAHLLLDAQQNSPLDAVHVVVPQAQALTFSTVPFVTVHDGPTEHTAEEADWVQSRPVVSVHPVVPQKHGASLVTAPSVFVQTGAAKQRHMAPGAQPAVDKGIAVLNQISPGEPPL